MKHFHVVTLFLIAFTIILAISLYALFGMTWYAHDILGAALPASCLVLFYGRETQPAFTIAAGCTGRDLVRIWPFPVQSPWFEDWWEPVEEVRPLMSGILSPQMYSPPISEGFLIRYNYSLRGWVAQ